MGATRPHPADNVDAAPPGLTTKEAAALLKQHGPNEVEQAHESRWRLLAAKFWAPVPWMLEATILLELVLARRVEAGIIAVLLVFNGVLGYVQESRAEAALTLLRQRLTVRARVRRDGQWQVRPARELVPGDAIHVRVGDLVPADLQLASGDLLVDHSALTGESLPVELAAGGTGFAGGVVKRGEATGTVTATGARTTFGRTAELVGLARTASHLETLIVAIVRYLVAFDTTLAVLVLVYAVFHHMALPEVLPFALILLVASVPVALPATFTLATALGAMELARNGVLVTRLAAIEEAAGMDVLCVDKTGTMTQNRLSVVAIKAYADNTEDDVLRLAALASDEATQDPIDLAIEEAARGRGFQVASQRLSFLPFDASTKRSEAVVQEAGRVLRVAKGAPLALAAGKVDQRLARDEQELAERGYRVLAVAAGTDETLQIAGLVALEDPPRPDSLLLIQSLRELGIRTLMVTGDGPTTARTIAVRLGIGERLCPQDTIKQITGRDVLDYDVFAGVYPEDKLALVGALQRAGHLVGMTGDGVNDSPALRQAEVGIAVASATDVAKASASVVLTSPGLSNVVAAVQASRRVYQRLLTYTLNKVIKTFQVALFLSLGLVLTGQFITTPGLIVLLLFANDFLTMSIATDRVSFSPHPDRWPVRALVLASLSLALVLLVLSLGVLWAARAYLNLGLPETQTLVFLWLVFSGQATVYLVRERRHFWGSRPSGWMLLSSCADVFFVSVLAVRGWLMAPVPVTVVAALFFLSLAYLAGVNLLKAVVFRRYKLAQ